MSGEERVQRYLAEAQPHSQGEFSWDGVRMAELLATYLEADPQDFALHCLAGAVYGGATYFRVRMRRSRICICWDGQVDLDSLGPEGNGGLALALHCAARLGKVTLSTPSGTLSFRSGQGWRRTSDTALSNSFDFSRRNWWSSLFNSEPLRRMRARGMFAPFTCDPEIAWKQPGVSWCVSWGSLPREVCRADHQVKVEKSEFGCGCAYPGSGRWLMVVGGVAYPMTAGWSGLDVVWWGDLPLDLNRAHLVHGQELQAWLKWFTLELGLITAQHHWEGVPLTLLLELDDEAVWRARWFRRSDGMTASLQDLEDYYNRWGILPVVGLPQSQMAFLFPDGLPSELGALFPNWIYLPSDYPLLPTEEDYLVKAPSSLGLGEIGLRANPGLGQRVWTGRGWKYIDRKPHGLDFSFETPQHYLDHLVVAYSCLLEQECQNPAAASFHVASLLDYLQFSRKIRSFSDSISLPHPHPPMGQLQLSALTERFPVQMLSGENRTLPEVLEHPDGFVNLNSAHGYVCDYLTFTLLWRRPGLAYGLRTRSCHLLLSRPGGTLLERILSDPACAAAGVLKRFPACRPFSEVEEVSARRELGVGSNTLSSFHLLLAMTQGQDKSLVLKCLPEYLEFENERDLAVLEPSCKGELRLIWLWGKVESLLRRQDFAQAEELAGQALAHFPKHWMSAYLLGECSGFLGYFEQAYAHLHDSLRRGGPSGFLQFQYWHSALLARRPVSQSILLEPPLSLSMKVLAAAQHSDSLQRVRAVQALLEEPGCPASAHEVLAQALADQALFAQACQSYRVFLNARHDQLMEFNLVARQQRARRFLAEHE